MVATRWPDGSDFAPLGYIGAVSGLGWSDSMPGGPMDLSCVIETEAQAQPQALYPGRIVEVQRGAGIPWEGILGQPAYSDGQGWQVAAKGAGNYGDNYRAVYTTWNSTDPIDQAITRGLRWTRSAMPGGLYLSQQSDSASSSITDFLTLITKPVGLTWHVGRGNVLSVFTVPTTPTRILMATSPQARALAGFINALYGRYEATADNATTGTAATYALALAINSASIARHQRQEEYWDLSQAGVLTGGAAAGFAGSALGQYQAASWAGPIPVQYGNYLTMTGVPVDLGTERAGEVVQLMLADGPYGGETGPGPVTFPVGKIEYDDTTQAAGITPYLGVPGDFSSLLDALATQLPVPAATS
jgi:hypothetical protein